MTHTHTTATKHNAYNITMSKTTGESNNTTNKKTRKDKQTSDSTKQNNIARSMNHGGESERAI